MVGDPPVFQRDIIQHVGTAFDGKLLERLESVREKCKRCLGTQSVAKATKSAPRQSGLGKKNGHWFLALATLQDYASAFAWHEDRASPSWRLKSAARGQYAMFGQDLAQHRLDLEQREVPAEAVLAPAAPRQPSAGKLRFF
jgi:hypothetical protein